MRKSHSSNTGFTLLELSIVLVIVSLLIAGVVGGSSLVEASKLQSVVADLDQYRKAAILYREKYSELPGDHSHATDITSADAGCDNPTASDNPATATCNGNGDGFIGDATGAACAAIATYRETLLVWQHLSNEHLINGNYNGRRSTASNQITPEVNVPMSRIKGASYMLANFPGTRGGGCAFFTADRANVIYFGLPRTSAAYPYLDPALPPDGAKSIDLKIDDGKPGMGKLVTLPSSEQAGCADSDNAATAVYGTSKQLKCALIYFTGL